MILEEMNEGELKSFIEKQMKEILRNVNKIENLNYIKDAIERTTKMRINEIEKLLEEEEETNMEMRSLVDEAEGFLYEKMNKRHEEIETMAIHL